MKSKFFTDTRDLDGSAVPRDRVCVCLCLNRRAYERVLARASERQMTSGEYIDRLILLDALSNGDTEVPCKSDSPWPCFPPAPPGH